MVVCLGGLAGILLFAFGGFRSSLFRVIWCFGVMAFLMSESYDERAISIEFVFGLRPVFLPGFLRVTTSNDFSPRFVWGCLAYFLCTILPALRGGAILYDIRSFFCSAHSLLRVLWFRLFHIFYQEISEERAVLLVVSLVVFKI